MSELDRFETRFAAAYRRYLDEAPTEVDAAAIARTVTAVHPRARAGSWPWARRPAGVLAWLVLLALVLAAVVAAVSVGSRLERKLPAVVPPVGPAFVCPPGSTPDRPGPADQARPPLAMAPPMAFDEKAGRIVLLAAARVGDTRIQETWTFDVCTNTWTRMQPSQEPTGGDQLVYAADSDVTIAVDSATRQVWTYDLATNTWTAKGVAPIDPGGRLRLAYDSATGDIVAAQGPANVDVSDPSRLLAYDVGTDTWTPVRQASPHAPGPYPFLGPVFDRSADRFILLGRDTELFDLRTGTWSTSEAVPPWVNYEYFPTKAAIAYDEATERTIAFGLGRVIAYDAAADRWETLVEGSGRWGPLGDGPTIRGAHAIVYDPVNERLVVYGGQYFTGDTWVQSDDVLAFDPVTRRWTVLLAATRVEQSS